MGGQDVAPLRLSDDELSAVMSAAASISVERRAAFLQQVARELANCPEIGPGVIHRIVRETQRAFFDAPD
jgi:hypothetical protein